MNALAPRPRLARNFAALMSSQLLTWVLGTFVAVVLPRFINPASLGQFRLATSVWIMAALFVRLGTSVYLTIEMSRDAGRASRLVGTILVIRALAFVMVSIVVAALVALAGIDRELGVLLLLMGIGTAVTTVSEVYAAALAGLEQMSHLARAAVAAKLSNTVVLLAVLFAGGDIVAVAASGIFGISVSVVLLSHAYGRFATVSSNGWVSSWRYVVRGSFVFLVAGGALVVYQQIDTIVMAMLVDREALGFYTTADTLFSSLLFVPTILLATVFPRLSRLHVEDPVALRQLVDQSFSLLMLLGVPIGLGIFVIGGEFAPLLFGEEYRQTGPVLQVFGLVTVFVYGTILFGGLARALDRQRLWIAVLAGGIVLTVPLDILLVPWTDEQFGNGAIGGALAFLVTESLMFIVGLWKVAPNLCERSTAIRVVKILLSGVVMAIAVWPLRGQLFVLPVAVGAVVYWLMIVVTRALSAQEKFQIQELRRRLRRSS